MVRVRHSIDSLMHALTPQQILTVWEAGLGQHPVERALTILLHASDGEAGRALAELSLGERDRRLLHVREQTFGRALDAYAECRRATDDCASTKWS